MENSKLEKLIPEYATFKNELDTLKKVVDFLNKEIKDLMIEENTDTAEYGGYKVSYIVQKKEQLDEDGLLEFLQNKLTIGSPLRDSLIKTKEYIDMDELETAIYNGDIDSALVADMGKFTTIKEVPTLRISKAKKKEGD